MTPPNDQFSCFSVWPDLPFAWKGSPEVSPPPFFNYLFVVGCSFFRVPVSFICDPPNMNSISPPFADIFPCLSRFLTSSTCCFFPERLLDLLSSGWDFLQSRFPICEAFFLFLAALPSPFIAQEKVNFPAMATRLTGFVEKGTVLFYPYFSLPHSFLT